MRRLLKAGRIDEIASSGEAAIPGFVGLLDDLDFEDAAMAALVRIGRPAVPPLLEALKNKEWYVRMNAAETLGKIGDSSAIPALARAFIDRDQGVREAATEALAKMGSPAFPTLIECLTAKSTNARLCAVEALGSSGDSSVVTAIIKVLKDPNEEVRETAIGALVTIATKAENRAYVIEQLGACSNHRSSLLLDNAARALCRIDPRG